MIKRILKTWLNFAWWFLSLVPAVITLFVTFECEREGSISVYITAFLTSLLTVAYTEYTKPS